MTIPEVQTILANIRDLANDPDKAHAAEDELYRLTLATIANGTGRKSALAREALKSREIDFPRDTA